MSNFDDSVPPGGSTLKQAFMKLIAMRPQDEADIQDLLAAYAGDLDLEYVRRELETFTESDDPRRTKFEAWLGEAGGGE